MGKNGLSEETLLGTVWVGKNLVPAYLLLERPYLDVVGFTHGMLLKVGWDMATEQLNQHSGLVREHIRSLWEIKGELDALQRRIERVEAGRIVLTSEGEVHYRQVYARIVARAILEGRHVPDSVIRQPGVQSARRRLSRVVKAEITARSSHGASRVLLESHGVLIKLQDGRPLPAQRVDEIRRELDWVFDRLGYDLSRALAATQTLLIHTNGKHPFRASGSSGLFITSQKQPIVYWGYAGDTSLRVLTHELAGHWLDHASAVAMGLSESHKYQSEMEAENAWLRRAAAYSEHSRESFDPAEVWANLVEQYIWYRASEKPWSGREYEKAPGYWFLGPFGLLVEDVEAGLADRLGRLDAWGATR